MVTGLWIMPVAPLRPEPIMSAISGLKPLSLASRNSFDSLTLVIMILKCSTNALGDELWLGQNWFWTNVIGALHHAFGFGGAAGIVVVHPHQRFTFRYRVTNFPGPLESNAKINRVAGHLASAA